MNLELWQAEAPDRVVFEFYIAPGKSVYRLGDVWFWAVPSAVGLGLFRKVLA